MRLVILCMICIFMQACGNKQKEDGQCAIPLVGTWDYLSGGTIQFNEDCTGKNLMCSTDFKWTSLSSNTELWTYTTNDSTSAGCSDAGTTESCLYSIQAPVGSIPERLLLQCTNGLMVFNRRQ